MKPRVAFSWVALCLGLLLSGCAMPETGPADRAPTRAAGIPYAGGPAFVGFRTLGRKNEP